ncbi:pH-response transcription factor [Ceratobasidium sp. AG-Ba]|nr:pH-response transcription factor [Ceratobasidium sp. AG-Ba]
MPPHADIGYGWETPALGKRARDGNGSDPSSPSDDFWTDAKKRKFQPTYDAQMAERLSSLSSLGFPPLGAAHPSLALHPNANSTLPSGLPGLPLPDPRSAEELAQWNQYLVKLGEQVASSVYAHALGLGVAPPPIAHPPPQQFLDPSTLAQFGLAGMPGLLGLGLGLGGLPGLGMLGAGAGLGGVDYNAIAAYQQAQAQALAVQSQIAAGLYPGLDLSALTAAAAANANAATPASTGAPADKISSPHRRPASSSSRRTPSESEFEFDALRPSRASTLGGMGPAPQLAGDKRSFVPLKAAPPAPVKEEDEMSVDEDAQLTPPPPVEPRLGVRTPGMPAKLGSSSGLYPTLPSLSPPSSSAKPDSGEKIKLPGISSLLEPSFRLRPVPTPRSPSSSDEDEEGSGDSESAATSRAGTPSASRRASSTVLPSFASIALNSEEDVKAKAQVEEQMKHIAVIQAMLVAVNRSWLEKTKDDDSERREEPRMREVEMVA